MAGDHQFAVMPPSITSSLPVTHEASSEAVETARRNIGRRSEPAQRGRLQVSSVLRLWACGVSFLVRDHVAAQDTALFSPCNNSRDRSKARVQVFESSLARRFGAFDSLPLITIAIACRISKKPGDCAVEIAFVRQDRGSATWALGSTSLRLRLSRIFTGYNPGG